MTEFTFREITPELWPDFEKLFGANGACGGCWCQSWRVPTGKQLWEKRKGRINKSATKKLILAGDMTGLLAYDGRQAVGWCSYGPRDQYARLSRMKPYHRDDTAGVWCINCFFIDKQYRQQGLARLLLNAALDYIRKRRIKIVEAYPTPLTLDGKKLPGAFVYAGPLSLFEKAGFTIVQRFSYSRPLVRKEL